jgi:hypothetical protein
MTLLDWIEGIVGAVLLGSLWVSTLGLVCFGVWHPVNHFLKRREE